METSELNKMMGAIQTFIENDLQRDDLRLTLFCKDDYYLFSLDDLDRSAAEEQWEAREVELRKTLDKIAKIALMHLAAELDDSLEDIEEEEAYEKALYQRSTCLDDAEEFFREAGFRV